MKNKNCQKKNDEDESKDLGLRYIEKITKDNENIGDEARKENLFKTCLNTMCHDTDELVGFLSSLHGQRTSASSHKSLQMAKKRGHNKNCKLSPNLPSGKAHIPPSSSVVPGPSVLVFVALL